MIPTLEATSVDPHTKHGVLSAAGIEFALASFDELATPPKQMHAMLLGGAKIIELSDSLSLYSTIPQNGQHKR